MSPKLRFSSDQLPSDIPDGARFRVWADLHAQNNGAFEWSRHDNAPFEALFERRELGGVSVGRMGGSLAAATRGLRQIAADNDDQFVLATANSPDTIRVSQRGREIGDASGSVFLLSMAEPIGVLTSHTANAWLNVMLPAKAIRMRAPMAEDLLAKGLADPTGVLKMLVAYANVVLDHEEFTDPQAVALASDHCLDLAVLALGARGVEAEVARSGGLRAVRLSAVLRRIGRGFANPELSVEGIAARLRLSSRYVHVLLQETGRGFTERVLELRLEAALRLLTRDPPCRISEAAFAVGFNDLSYFNRCFRRRYGMTPTGARGRPAQ